MKCFLLMFFSCFFRLIYSQTCGCSKEPMLKNIISCKPTQFKNKAKIFWEYNCNSSWITFQKGKYTKKIFSLEKQYIELSGRLGYRSWTEYKNSFLIENSMVSGCCQPAEYILYYKESGEKIRELGTIIFIDDSKISPYILTMKNYDVLLFTNLNNNKSYNIKIPKNRIQRTLNNSKILYPEKLFGNIQLKNSLLSMELEFMETKNSKWKKQIIKFDTKNYSKDSL